MTKKKEKKDVTLVLTVNKHPKKDKRTKAELIKQLNDMIKNYSDLDELRWWRKLWK